MALQTDNLVMVGLSIENDQPSNSIQPKLVKGIHLRWAFKPERGFPWHGYYLFRRQHHSGDPQIVRLDGTNLQPGSTTMNSPAGRLESDSSLTLTNFLPTGATGFDLDRRNYLKFFPSELARQVEVRLGFLQSAEVKITAFLKKTPVAQAIVGGNTNQVVPVSLEFDAISAIEFSSGSAVLLELSYVPVAGGNELANWQDVPNFIYPMSLPVTHTDYPLTTGTPEALALGRILYGPHTDWAGTRFAELHGELVKLVDGGPLGMPMAQKFSKQLATPPSSPQVEMPKQYPLHTVLLGALHPAIAQMVGLYWVDQTINDIDAYDYLIVAAHDTLLGNNASHALTRLRQIGFDDPNNRVDGFIVFNKSLHEPALPLDAPSGLKTYALPSGPLRPSASLQPENNAGLRWDLGVTNFGALLPGKPMMYHLWRAGLGNGENPTTPTNYKLITKYGAVLVVNPVNPSGKTSEPPRDWPPERLHYLDTGLADGWYSYQVSGVDIFGRHSLNSPPGPWLQWTPAPKPKPWYYIEPPPTNLEVHPSAVRLRDTMPPPPPTGIEAYALDPQDPTVLKDAAYTSWWNALTASQWYEKELTKEQKEELIGLRVRWRWTHAHAQQAPDTHEFRIYFHPDPMNVLVGKIVSVTAASAKESDVEISVNTPLASNAYQGLWLQIGNDAFKVISIQSGNPLRLRVKNIGTNDEVTPQVNMPFSLVIPLRHKENYPNGHPDFVDYSIAAHWKQRYHVVDYNAHFSQLSGAAAVISGSTVTLDGDPNLLDGQLVGELLFLANDTSRADKTYSIKAINNTAKTVTVDGTPNTGGAPTAWRISLRTYEIFLPTADGRFKTGAPLETSQADPIKYGYISVSAADDKTYTPDKRMIGDWANRTGNEGPVGAPAKIFRVHRKPPDPPALPLTDSDKVYATPADYHNRSFYTFRWVPISNVKTHIFRALDESLFKLDWLIRTTRAALNPILPWHKGYFPDIDPEDGTPWGLQRKQTAATQLNAITSLTSYSGLSNDARKLLARLPGNEGTKWDNGLQQRDWEVRASRKSLIPGDSKYFPGGWSDPRREPDVAATLNALKLVLTGAAATTAKALVTLDGTPDLTLVQPYRDRLWLEGDTEQPDGIYRIIAVDTAANTVTLDGVPKLTGSASAWAIYLDPYQTLKKTNQDALRVLAGLPGNERAFTQVTIQTLDPNDPANANRRGPDDPDNFAPGDPNNPLAATTLCAYKDTLDGRSTNAYFYRAGSVDGVHNRSEQLSLSSPPVYCPDVVPPSQPAGLRALASADREITLKWTTNREADLDFFQVYRTESLEAARDIRWMSPQEPKLESSEPDPLNRAAIETWIDLGVEGGHTYYYRVVAVDINGNSSVPSTFVAARAYDSTAPASPAVTAAWNATHGRVALTWIAGGSDLSYLMERQSQRLLAWRPISAWLPGTTGQFEDGSVQKGETYTYRLRVRRSSGEFNAQYVPSNSVTVP